MEEQVCVKENKYFLRIVFFKYIIIKNLVKLNYIFQFVCIRHSYYIPPQMGRTAQNCNFVKIIEKYNSIATSPNSGMATIFVLYNQCENLSNNFRYLQT